MKSKQLVIAVMVSMFSFGICQSVLSQDKPVQTWSAKSQSTDYRIGAGDMIEVSVWKEPDLSRKEVLVRVDGKISFPLIGDIQAAGVTPAELTETIQKGLTNYVTAPVVTVTVTNPGSQKVYVLGEVARTGEYPILKSLTVLQAFALAGGFTQWAAKDEIHPDPQGRRQGQNLQNQLQGHRERQGCREQPRPAGERHDRGTLKKSA